MLSSLVAVAAAILVQVPEAPPPAATSDEELVPPALASPAELAPAAPAPAPGWYGLPAAVVDGAAVALGAVAFATRDEALLYLGAAGYLLGAPLNHLANRRYGAAAGSLTLRVGASALAVVVYVASFVNQGCDNDAGPRCNYVPGALLGGLVMATAAIVDDAAIAYRAAPPPPSRRLSWAPALVVTPNLGLLSLGGAF
jgi:hypothetical protein